MLPDERRLPLPRVKCEDEILFPAGLSAKRIPWQEAIGWEGAEVLECPVIGCAAKFMQSRDPDHVLSHHERLSQHWTVAHGERVRSYPWKWLAA